MIVITGASGLLGSNMVMHAMENARTVTAVSHRHPTRFPAVENISLDLLDVFAVQQVIPLLKPSHIIHCAGLTHVDECERHPEAAVQINAEASGKLAELSLRLGAKFVYISTDSVFDGIRGMYSEEDRVNPINQYARSKHRGEQAVLEANPQSLVIRTNMYGWNLQDKFSLSEWMLHQLENRKAFNGFEDVIFSPLLVNDLSEVVFQFMEQDVSGIFHVGSSGACSKYQFGLKLREVFAMDPSLITPISIDSVTFHAKRPKNTSLQTSKTAKVLNRMLPSVSEGLERLKQLRDRGYADRLKSYGGSAES